MAIYDPLEEEQKKPVVFDPLEQENKGETIKPQKSIGGFIGNVGTSPVPFQSGKMSEVPIAVGETLASIGTNIAALPFVLPKTIDATYEKYAGSPKPISPVNIRRTGSIPSVSKQLGIVGTPEEVRRLAMEQGLSVPSVAENTSDTLARIGQSMVYEPKTQTGRNVQEIMSIPYRLLNKVAGGAGEITKKITESPVVATGVDLGIQALPFFLPGVKKVIGKTGIPERLYTSAIKPSIKQKLPVGKRSEAMQAGVEEGILPTTGGLEKLGSKIDTIEGKIDAIIENGKTTSRPIKTIDIANSLDDLIKSYDQSGMPVEHYQGILEVRNKVLSQGNSMSIGEAQKFKQNTYKFIRKSYGELSGAVTEAQKTVARAVKERIAKQFPEVNNLNQKAGPMLELEDQIQRAVKRIQNRDIIGIGLPIKALAARMIGGAAGGAGAGYATGHPMIGTIVGLALGVMDTPRVKAALAIALDRAGKFSGSAGKAIMEGALPYGMNRPTTPIDPWKYEGD